VDRGRTRFGQVITAGRGSSSGRRRTIAEALRERAHVGDQVFCPGWPALRIGRVGTSDHPAATVDCCPERPRASLFGTPTAQENGLASWSSVDPEKDHSTLDYANLRRDPDATRQFAIYAESPAKAKTESRLHPEFLVDHR
jgi:hypothetical protein